MCIESIVAEKDITAARERNKAKWNEGKTLHDKMKEWRAPSGGEDVCCRGGEAWCVHFG